MKSTVFWNSMLCSTVECYQLTASMFRVEKWVYSENGGNRLVQNVYTYQAANNTEIFIVTPVTQIGPIVMLLFNGAVSIDTNSVDDRVIINVEQSVEWELTGATEELVEKLPHCHFVHHKCHMIWPGIEHGPPRWKDVY
jgi:hypothetical protein